MEKREYREDLLEKYTIKELERRRHKSLQLTDEDWKEINRRAKVEGDKERFEKRSKGGKKGGKIGARKKIIFSIKKRINKNNSQKSIEFLKMCLKEYK